MPGVKVVVDSTSDVPRNLAEELGITVVPLSVHFGDETYLDWVELTPLEFYDLLETSPHHPRTSPPSPSDFARVYEELAADGSSLVSIHISSALSETVKSAEMGRAMVGGGRIEVIDSRVVSAAFGLPAVEAARAAKEGASFEEVVGVVREILEKSAGKVFFAVDTLDYLVRNGRIGRAQAILGTLLAVKPVLTITDGFVAPFEKVRGEKRVIPRMVDILGEHLDREGGEVVFGIVHANCMDKVQALKQAVHQAYGIEPYLICDLGAVVGTHSGPGTIGMMFYQK